MSKALVIAEHNGHELSDATLCTISAARSLTNEIDLLVIGHHCEEAASQSDQCPDISNTLMMDHDAYQGFLPEQLAPAIVDICQETPYQHILIPATGFGKNLLPRIGALLDLAPVTDVIEILGPNQFKRPMYAGSVIATVQSDDPVILLSVRTTAFDKAIKNGPARNTITAIDTHHHTNNPIPEIISVTERDSSRPDLTNARVVIAGGRGFGSSDAFKMLESLADLIPGCAIGASRAAVDENYISNEHQVGQTGKIIAPDLYIAVGISGAVQHIAGMSNSKIIVAINKDPNAPIFKIADVGLVGDLFDVLPELETLLKHHLAQ